MISLKLARGSNEVVCPFWAPLVSISNKFKLIKAPVSGQSRFMNDLGTAIPPDSACCGSFLLDSHGESLYCQLLKKRLFITTYSQLPKKRLLITPLRA